MMEGCCLLICSARFRRQSRTTCPGLTPPTESWSLPDQSWVRRTPPKDLPTGLSGRGSFSVEAFSSWVTLACIELTKPSQYPFETPSVDFLEFWCFLRSLVNFFGFQTFLCISCFYYQILVFRLFWDNPCNFTRHPVLTSVSKPLRGSAQLAPSSHSKDLLPRISVLFCFFGGGVEVNQIISWLSLSTKLPHPQVSSNFQILNFIALFVPTLFLFFATLVFVGISLCKVLYL